MTAPVIAGRLVAARTLPRLLGCGCAAVVATVVLPLFMLFSLVSGVLSGFVGSPGASQVDGGSGGLQGVAVGTAQPLPAGTFTVSQGFGCTAVTVEGPPPAPYQCPPDGGHVLFTRFHGGIDLAAGVGTTVSAVVGGVVRVAYSTSGFGLRVVLSAAAAPTVVYLYGHLSGTAVADGATVRAGEPIAYVGTTGNSTGPHLHFEVDVGGVPVNPCAAFPAGYLAPPGIAAAGCLAAAM